MTSVRKRRRNPRYRLPGGTPLAVLLESEKPGARVEMQHCAGSGSPVDELYRTSDWWLRLIDKSRVTNSEELVGRNMRLH